ncbi:MAG: HNH endonuclease [Candidatus Paceibacterota bacterium]
MPSKGYKMSKEHKDAISKALKGHVSSEETRRKIGLANRGVWIKFNCDYCGKENEEKQSHYKKKVRHFCDAKCYASFVKEKQPLGEKNAYKGVRKIGENKQVYHRNYVKNHPENIAHLKARRYARERNAEGSHTLAEWIALKLKYDNKCIHCKEFKPLTKDHILPLAEGGTDYIHNIQPLCRNCNSKKWKKLDYVISQKL